MFSCEICKELVGESTYSTPCGHVFHLKCITTWLNRSATCPNCRSNVISTDLIKLFMLEDERFQVKTKEELDLLMRKLRSLRQTNVSNVITLRYMKRKLNTLQTSLKESQNTSNQLRNAYKNIKEQLDNFNTDEIKTPKIVTIDKYNKEKYKNEVLKKEMYELQAINSVELNKLKSERIILKAENDHYQSYNYRKPNRSKVKTRNKNMTTDEIPPILQLKFKQPLVEGFLSNCHFWIINEHKELLGDSYHLHFNEHRLIEHGATVAYEYSSKVTHVLCNSQKNSEVLKGLSEYKKCVTDYWLSDIISEKKMIQPWLAHHFPIPYSYNNLPCKYNQIAIVNFEKNEYHRVKAMAEFVGACINNKISHKTDIVISQKLEGEMIKRANALKIPTVNVQWINDIILGEEISVIDSNNTKYQQFDLSDPFSINYVRVSHLMEAWKERSRVHCIKIDSDSKTMKTCCIHDFTKSNDDGESNKRNKKTKYNS
ncbi:PAX-interacting protein 1-like [Rhopalosiphum maidis]|uniref:PAX-interacting protein 1-like n=1 Tax=Rhopalosiphum maidis TaxID=43146 RepID=UPI000EFDD836|nr:PAX-interacting protein 1-like [Rhopalosiphum maidis]XP_026819810.1 PAX-interacting protein 1-like [Rhopalosiphum maidis]